jgi:NADH-quinone oxidoreductase subunit J
MVNLTTVPFLTIFLPILTAVLAVVARNPIHAIRWLISTFLVTCGLIFQHFKLGFTTALIIIVYIGAIAILFLFIVMLIPVKERPQFGHRLKR